MSKNTDWASLANNYINELEAAKAANPKAWYDPGAGREKTMGAIATLAALKTRLDRLQ